MAGKPKIDLDAMKRRLAERRAELTKLLADSKAERTEDDMAQQREGRLARMDAVQRQAVDQERDRRRANELNRIHAALERIESGDYGYCTSCDEPIAVRRLENDPAVALCIDCAAKAEA